MSTPPPKVPSTVPFSKVKAFCADLGIPTDYLLEFRAGMNGVFAEFVAQDESGKPYLSAPGSNRLATHRISIPMDTES